MNIIVKHSSPDAVVSDLLAIGLFEGQSVKEAGYGTLDAALGGLIEQVFGMPSSPPATSKAKRSRHACSTLTATPSPRDASCW